MKRLVGWPPKQREAGTEALKRPVGRSRKEVADAVEEATGAEIALRDTSLKVSNTSFNVTDLVIWFFGVHDRLSI